MCTVFDPPAILQVYREAIRPGCAANYAAIEEEITRACATLGCPHPYLGAEQLGVGHAWFFNGYRSAAEQAQIGADYAANGPLIATLTELATRKAKYTEAPTEIFATYRPHLTNGVAWRLGDRRRFVIIFGDPQDGTVFETSDGTYLTVSVAPESTDADAAATRRSDVHVLTVRPTWSNPDPAWIARDPEFWASYPPR